MGKTGFFRNKKITGILSVVALLAGFILLDNSLTGNVILESGPSFNPLSIVGLVLIFCSALLVFYTVRS